jgi:hypothetical protein
MWERNKVDKMCGCFIGLFYLWIISAQSVQCFRERLPFDRSDHGW